MKMKMKMKMRKVIYFVDYFVGIKGTVVIAY